MRLAIVLCIDLGIELRNDWIINRPANHLIVEMIELKDHPWFIATQAHPEFKSRPNKPHPLFKGFIEAALKYEDILQAEAEAESPADAE